MAKVQSPTTEMGISSPIPVNVTQVNQEQTDLDLVALTMAALRFVNPWSVSVGTNNQWEDPQDRIIPGSTEAKDRTITLAEVSQHDMPDDCWVVIYDRVYDITTFFDEVS